jgi:NADH-quinone oxidoreductase subunit N
VKAMFINKSENPIGTFKSDFSTRLALGICVAGIVVSGFASIIFEAIRNLSYGV